MLHTIKVHLTWYILTQGQTGLGIMIIEGKHAEYGNGIFISDLQEGSVAAEVRISRDS